MHTIGSLVVSKQRFFGQNQVIISTTRSLRAPNKNQVFGVWGYFPNLITRQPPFLHLEINRFFGMTRLLFFVPSLSDFSHRENRETGLFFEENGDGPNSFLGVLSEWLKKCEMGVS